MKAHEITLRPATAADLAAVERMGRLAPEAAHWNPSDYLEHDFRVAVAEAEVTGFVVARSLGNGEAEILDLAVAPEWRRRGIAGALVRDLAATYRQALFLEVRESNSTARNFYQAFGFKEVGRRPEYYRNPPEVAPEAAPEAAVVMRFSSCYCHN